MDIQLTFINNSNTTNNSDVVIFQKNMVKGFNADVVAWTVIQNCGKGSSHTVTYPINTYVAAQDSWGNTSALELAEDGQSWAVIRSKSGDVISLNPSPTSFPDTIEIKNSLPIGSVDTQIYKDGRLLATKVNVVPGLKGIFQFVPKLYIGTVYNVEEGDIINADTVSRISTAISLKGLAKAEIIMNGGGAMPIVFNLGNVVHS